VAVAMVDNGKFMKFHSEMMEKDLKSEADIKSALKSAKIDVMKIDKVLKNRASEIEKRINDNKEIGFDATPAIIIGDEFVGGYLDAKSIKDKLNK
jgi:protein-disulfide isomerase